MTQSLTGSAHADGARVQKHGNPVIEGPRKGQPGGNPRLQIDFIARQTEQDPPMTCWHFFRGDAFHVHDAGDLHHDHSMVV